MPMPNEACILSWDLYGDLTLTTEAIVLHGCSCSNPSCGRIFQGIIPGWSHAFRCTQAWRDQESQLKLWLRVPPYRKCLQGESWDVYGSTWSTANERQNCSLWKWVPSYQLIFSDILYLNYSDRLSDAFCLFFFVMQVIELTFDLQGGWDSMVAPWISAELK